MNLLAAEQKIWQKSERQTQGKAASELDILEKYDSQECRILTEINREKLPNFVQSLRSTGETRIKLQPAYQRRKRWSEIKKSRLIESFLVNIPIPPIILYEVDIDLYEVMDGQQRITAIHEFYSNKLRLEGLELWPELNGKCYEELPQKIRAGIDRRAISSIVIITESTSDPERAMFLKQITFERINTGGVDLSAQEVRNCLYQGKFNSLLIQLSENPLFMQALGIDEQDKESSSVYKKMEDVELVLRFFALRSIEHFTGNLKSFLTLYMTKTNSLSEDEVKSLGDIFIETIDLATQLYGNNPFKPPFAPQNSKWKKRFYKAYYDVVMVSLSKRLENRDLLLQRRDRLIEETRQLFNQDSDSSHIFTGGGKDTRQFIKERINIFESMLTRTLN
ncbi:DUF262 domain-containing protein [Baaleninema simplex]|uniref:DUF262 domain-containing protein n=1 Tax=Baaleninema simplex TaxID=2862350 RepID=UPI00034A4CEE|nr:DUF262 domain-containing protein [Baaleninema simplex]